MSPETDQQVARDLYDAWHGQHEFDAEAEAHWHRMIKTRLDPAQDLAGRRILEIGWGRSGFACWLATQPARPAEAMAGDLSATAVEKGWAAAAARGIDLVTWTTADIEDLSRFGSQLMRSSPARRSSTPHPLCSRSASSHGS